MNDEVDIVHQNPVAFASSFNVKGPDTQLSELLVDAVCDGLVVAR